MSHKPYVTERTKMWRGREIKPSFVEAIGVVEEFGSQVMSVAADTLAESWSYTTGVYDNCSRPELITIGLPSKVAQSALNESVRRLRNGVDLVKDRQGDIIGNVDVEFRAVDAKWLHHIMLRTSWFYEGADVPVLQLIYPDLENRFQNEEGFDRRFEQPILSGEIKYGSVEYEFWKSHGRPNDPPPLLN